MSFPQGGDLGAEASLVALAPSTDFSLWRRLPGADCFGQLRPQALILASRDWCLTAL